MSADKILDKEELIKAVLEYNPKANVTLLRKAYDFAKEAHAGKKRLSGDPYFIHPLEVTKSLILMRLDTPTLCAALLHDVLEDTKIKADKITELFGDEIASLVEGVTKIDEINLDGIEARRAENVRKVLLATIKDVRVILIKLADRLHNMETLKYMTREKQISISKETLDIYAPIAHKLGMSRTKSILEDLCLRYLEPEIYQYFKIKINKKIEEREAEVKAINERIEAELNERGIKDAKVFGRAKSFYSIYKKMQKKNVAFNEIFDLVAIRIIVSTIPQCYSALGVIHTLWKPMPHKFKDYISVPKSNDYQSLHTVVVGSHGKILEVQIRTKDMHYRSEEGIAAHWLYKGDERDKQFDKKIAWLKQILDWMRMSTDSKEFIETLKIDLFKDEIIVFTPKGEPIPLPEKSTPIDFAYEVHTEVGNHCCQAKVNNRIVSLDRCLKSGDIVEIITSSNARPSRNWLSFVKTNLAKSKIRQTLNIKIDKDPKKAREEIKEKENKEETLATKKKSGLKFSKCCNPKFGDDIRAFRTTDGKLTIHRKDCINVHSLEPSREVDMRWEAEKEPTVFRVFVDVSDKVGILAELLKIVADKINTIHAVHSKAKKDRVTIQFDVEIRSEEILEEICTELKTRAFVLGVTHKKIGPADR
ncbi:(p)ppGpp synthetase [Candidatus Woesearchaeota archaeon CG11_big_fil_rev_8_21_14_0_20_43_8]|nr:MAG: (p)ppGpp synthetase [Candidatus Woesearchaeota archaeon CG11_big_fil_rev_8_21_14_0_20_43_8]